MKKAQVILAGLLLVSLVFIYQTLGQESRVSANNTADPGTNVLYIPLDNRPVNYQNALELARLAGFNPVFPTQEQLAGNGELNTWLTGQIPHYGAAVLSLDMLLYGGLVDSRKHNLTMDEIAKRVNLIKSIKKDDHLVYAFISIMRAPMANTPHTMPDYYNTYGAKIFKYGQLMDKDRLGIIEPAEAKRLSELTSEIPGEYLKDFTARRDKNYQATVQVLKLVQQGYIDRLVISKDDTAPYGFTRMEAERLTRLVQRYNIAGKVEFLAGTDECGQLLLAAMANKLGAGVGDRALRVYVDYACRELAGDIPLYEDVPLQENILLHIKAIGAELTALPGKADLVLAVHNGPGSGEPQQQDAYEVTEARQQFIERIKNYNARGTSVAIADVNRPNMADAGFMQTLNTHYDLSQLAGYSGWNTAGNSVGLALSQGIIATGHTGAGDPGFAEKQRDIILKCLLEDWGYQAITRPVIREKVPVEQQTLMTDPQLEQQTTAEIARMLNDFADRNLREDFGNVEVTEVNLPWHRLFDIDFEVQT
ncbi:DUF4127 family protein [Desulfallas thermosapovorans]|uniref:Uncharacterized protein DUF4127 n=1 Tax=Desulfallas thermosapovorans DSM 6562 TaxID=1121431 RepID=A0A5S4ZQ04_9FIRM|nr:DUF4127 family protein [Desulfallas thermosapovorans]TYO93260.1 uncharacterized protein DUF4127 [Desulfallas thermosapovorans DSM 6562]